MPDLPVSYATGTVTLGAGSTTVTGSGTSWIAAGLEAGDIFWAAGLSVRIASVNSATSLTLAFPWPGAALSGANYEVRFTPDATRVLSAAREVLSALTNGNLSSLAGLTTSANKLAYYTGAGTAALTTLSAFARTLIDDADQAAMRATLGLVPTGSATDTTAGRLHRTDDDMLRHALRRYGSYSGPSGSVSIDDMVAGDAGLFHDSNPGTWPITPGARFWWISTQALYLNQAAVQRAVLYSSNAPGAGADEFMRRRSAGGTWGAWRLVYNSGSLVGTVSQSGGVPTGRSFEPGINANGWYIRVADGTQICQQTLALTGGGDPTITAAWTFPAAFAATPAILASLLVAPAAGTRERSYWQSTGTTALNIKCSMNANWPASTSESHLITAIGRWF